MIFRFWFASIFGFIFLVSILLFGAKGAISFVLLPLCPLIMRIKKIKYPDERELHLFYKTGNLTLGLAIIAIIIIHHFQDALVNGHLIGDNWMYLTIISIFFAHGLAGLIIFKTQ
jgi:hypothetical protein